MKKHISLTITGSVQGVFFRYHTKEQAQSLGVTGWVTNQDDGSVHIEAEGTEEQLERFLSWCQYGPIHAVVAKVETTESAHLQNYSDFRIIYPN